MIIKPHSGLGMQPVLQYEFKDVKEIEHYIELANKVYIDNLYFLVKSIWSDLISTKEKELLVLLSADTIHSYFQEMFVTVHYLRLTGPPGWGKGAILLTFKLLGYRVVLAGDMSGANLLDILGPIEKSQVSIAEDEFDNIEDDEDKERIYKMGYEDVGFVTRTVDPSSSDREVRYYNPFCIKIFGGEQAYQSKKLGGFNDRTFNTEVTKGKPKRLVKELKNQMEKPPEKQLPKYRKIIERITFLRKLLLVYKLIHHNDTIEEINTNIDSRPLELCGPALRLFNSTKLANGERKALNEVKDALSHFLRKKGQLDEKTIEVVLYGVLKKLFEEIDEEGLHSNSSRKNIESKIDGIPVTIYTLTYDLICETVMHEVEGIPITARSFDSADYGAVSHDFILQKCRTIFKAENVRISVDDIKKKSLQFNAKETHAAGASFDVVTDIKIYDEPQEEDAPEDHEVTEIWNNIGCGKNERACPSVLVFQSFQRIGQNSTLEPSVKGLEHEKQAQNDPNTPSDPHISNIPPQRQQQ